MFNKKLEKSETKQTAGFFAPYYIMFELLYSKPLDYNHLQ
jgi:hypothetical protein